MRFSPNPIYLSLFLIIYFGNIFPKTFSEPSLFNRILPLEKQTSLSLDEIRWAIGEIILTDTIITNSGLYILGKNLINESIEIDTNSVIIDLNGYTIYDNIGTRTTIIINENYYDITIKNGSLQGYGGDLSTSSGILINPGTNLIRIENMNISDFNKGINLDGITTSTIIACYTTDCLLKSNRIGVFLNYGIKCIFNNCKAYNCLETGFDFNYGIYNQCNKCENLEIINSVPDITKAVGFSSSNGKGNIFNECLSNKVQKNLGTFGSLAAGFMLANNEIDSMITNCLISDSIASGTADSYGIYLAASPFLDSFSLELLTSFTHSTVFGIDACGIRSVDWSPDGQYLAIGGWPSNGSGGAGPSLRILSFHGLEDEHNVILTEMVNYSFASNQEIFTVRWSKDGQYIAVGGAGPLPAEVIVLEFNRVSRTLIPVATFVHGADVVSVEWHPFTSSLLIAGRLGVGEYFVRVLNFDGSSLTNISSINPGISTVPCATWSPNGKWVAAVGFSDDIKILAWDGFSLTSAVTYNHGNYLQFADWSPNGAYLAICGFPFGGIGTRILRFDGTTLIPVASLTSSIVVRKVFWSPDINNLAICEINDSGTALPYLKVIKFDGSSLTTLASYNHGIISSPSGVRTAAWSSNGAFLAMGGWPASNTNSPDVRVFTGFTGIENCNIENNLVSNCEKSETPGGGATGISGSSKSNLIIRNLSYENNISFSLGVYNINAEGLNGSSSSIINILIPPY